MEDFDIFVYCGGKSGSMTLYQTFVAAGYKTIHLHSNSYWKGMHNKPYSIFDVVDNSSKNKKVYIIDAYRTPIERKISSFFENKDIFVPNLFETYTLEQGIQLFNNKFLNTIETYQSIDEIMNYYQIPLFDTFDFEKRYNMVEKDNKIFVKILFADIGRWDTILSQIIGKPINLVSDNLTKNKYYVWGYEEFNKYYRVPLTYLQSLESDKNFLIYCSKEQKSAYIQKWMSRTC